MHLRFAIHVAEQATSLRVGDLSLWVYPYASHERHVEQQRAVGDGQTRDVVSATLDAEQDVVFARKLHARDHVGDAEAARDDGGLPVDHGVPDGSGLLIAGVVRLEQLPTETRLQTVTRVLLQVDLAALQGSRSHCPGPFCCAPKVPPR